MKEKLYTIPLMDAFRSGDECPFCFIERKLEQDALDFTLGSSSSYMESDIRDQTDRMGFCREHFKKMYAYGNTVGNGLILKTHYHRLNGELQKQLEAFTPQKQSFMSKLVKTSANLGTDAIGRWVEEKESSCFICDHMQNTYERYIDTFFYLFKQDPEFVKLVQESKGFCFHHFGDLTKHASTKLNTEQVNRYVELVFPLMKENLERLEDELSWLVDKFDYRNADADWKNSRDALPRGMQKLRGGYPQDGEYKSKR